MVDSVLVRGYAGRDLGSCLLSVVVHFGNTKPQVI